MAQALSRHKIYRCKILKTENEKEMKMEDMVDRLIENQAAQLKVVEKFQDQVSTLIAKLPTGNELMIVPAQGVNNHQPGLKSSTAINTNNQTEKTAMFKQKEEENAYQLEQQQQDDQVYPVSASSIMKVKKRAKAKLEIELEEEVEILPWDDASPIRVTTEQMRDAFASNPVLREYASFNTTEMTDPKKAPPYVLEVLMDLVRRGHEAPETRNVQLNPARADQARVKTADKWEVRELGAVARLLFEAVSNAMRKSTLSEAERQKLERDVQEAVAWTWQLYESAPTEYVQKAQKPLAAHLVNMITPPVVAQSRLEAAKE
jgi:hypothetical protein